MNVDYTKENKTLTLRLTEEIDQHTADRIRMQIDNEITRYSPKTVVFDFKNMSFMDSSGIGMVLGRYKLTKMIGGNFKIVNVGNRMKKIFDMSGVSRIIDIEEEVKEEEINEGVI